MKKNHILIIFILLNLILSTACSFKVEKSNYVAYGDSDNKVVYESRSSDYLKEKDNKDLQFYKTIEDSLYACKSKDIPITNIKKIIKVINKDNKCDIFFIHNKDGKDYLTIFKLQKMMKDNKIVYSEPIYAVEMQWKAQKSYIKSLKEIYNSKLLLGEKVDSDLYLYNSSGAFSLGKTGGNVKWGLYHNRDIYNLTINGQKPNEIIELTMDDEKAYFWYYENLEVYKETIGEAEIKY